MHLAWRLHLAAGVAIGLAIAARYFMVALVAPCWPSIFCSTCAAARWGRSPLAERAFLGLLSVPVIFLLSVPTLLPNFAKVVTDLRTDRATRTWGPTGFPSLATCAGTQPLGWCSRCSGRWQSPFGRVLSCLWLNVRCVRYSCCFALTFLVGVSLSPLHWHRLIIPDSLPVLMLAAAVTLDRLTTWAARRSPRLATAYFGVGVLLLLAWPLGKQL